MGEHSNKVGLIVRANNRGLGSQSWDFYRHLKPHKTVAVLLDGDDPKTLERYPDAVVARGGIHDGGNTELLHFADCDVVLSFETFYNPTAVRQMKADFGTKFVLQPNYEQPADISVADKIIVPSVWHFDDWKHPNKVYIPVPVDRKLIPFKIRTKARNFIHNAGTQFGDDRNGTIVLLNAMQYVNSDIVLTIRLQKLSEMLYNKVIELAKGDPRIKIDERSFDNYFELWREGDVFIYPRAYAGLSLPVNEAMSAGIPVVMPCMAPQQEFLPKQLLVQLSGFTELQMARGAVQSAIIDPRTLAEKIDELAGLDKTAITYLSKRMDHVAECWSWDALLPKYNEALKLC